MNATTEALLLPISNNDPIMEQPAHVPTPLQLIAQEQLTVKIDNLDYYDGERNITGSATFTCLPQWLPFHVTVATHLQESVFEDGSCNVHQSYGYNFTMTFSAKEPPVEHSVEESVPSSSSAATLSFSRSSSYSSTKGGCRSSSNSAVYFNNEELVNHDTKQVNEPVMNKLKKWWQVTAVADEQHLTLKDLLKETWSKLSQVPHGNAFPFELTSC